MKRISFLLLLLSAFAGSGAVMAQPVIHADTLPLRIVHGKVLIGATIGQRPACFILDTGGRTLITADSAEYHNVEITGRYTVSDTNSANVEMLNGAIKDLHIGKLMKWQTAKTLVTPANNFFKALGVTGILGGEAFSQVCVTLDMRDSIMIINYPYRPSWLSRNDAGNMNLSNDFHSYIPVAVGDKTIEVLFDTGFHDFLSLSEADMEALGDRKTVEQRGSGFIHVGVGGIRNATPDSIYKVSISSMTVGKKEFRDTGSLTQKRRYSILGLELLEYGRMVLDYPRGKFYFIPFDEGPQQMREATGEWNVTIMPIGTHFEITATIGETDARPGERVWAINGNSLSDTPPSQLEINAIFGRIGGDTAEIAVGGDGENTRTILIKKI